MLCAAVVLPFVGFTTLAPWPLQDEGHELFYGLEFARDGFHRLLLGDGIREPWVSWVWGILLRFTTPSLGLLRAFGILLSLAAVAFSYLAVRRFLGHRMGAAVAALYAFTFPAFMLSRLTMGPSAIPMFQWASWWLLGRFLGREGDERPILAGALLGAVVGLGFTTWIPFACAALPVVAVAALHTLGRPRDRALKGAAFALLLAIPALPMAVARFSPEGFSFISSRYGGADSGLKDLAAWLWDGSGSAPYGPAWGGMFNPAVGAWMLLGWIEIFGRRRSIPRALYASALLAAFLPAFLTRNVEILRTLPALPFLLLAAAAGLGAWWNASSHRTRPYLLAALAAASVGLDACHAVFHYFPQAGLPEHRRGWRSDELRRAYGLLRDRLKGGPPTALLIHFFPSYRNPTLYALTRDLDLPEAASARDPSARRAVVRRRLRTLPAGGIPARGMVAPVGEPP